MKRRFRKPRLDVFVDGTRLVPSLSRKQTVISKEENRVTQGSEEDDVVSILTTTSVDEDREHKCAIGGEEMGIYQWPCSRGPTHRKESPRVIGLLENEAKRKRSKERERQLFLLAKAASRGNLEAMTEIRNIVAARCPRNVFEISSLSVGLSHAERKRGKQKALTENYDNRELSLQMIMEALAGDEIKSISQETETQLPENIVHTSRLTARLDKTIRTTKKDTIQWETPTKCVSATGETLAIADASMSTTIDIDLERRLKASWVASSPTHIE